MSNGDDVLIPVNRRPVVFDGHDVELTLGEDVAEHRRAEAALRESEAALRVLFDAHPVPVLIFDAGSLEIVNVNEAAVALYQYSHEDFVGLKLLDVQLPAETPKVTNDLSATMDTVWRGSGVHRRKDGSRIEVDIVATPVSLGGRKLRMAVIFDVTERRHLEEQVRQSQKMEAIGSLAGGVAHDFNNILSVILSYATMAIADTTVGSPQRADLDEIVEAARRAAGLTRQLVAFSRKQVLQPHVVEMNSILSGVESMLRRVLGEDIELSFVLSSKLDKVFVDPGQFEQVVMNLVVNARDAMPAGGKLTIETSNVTLDEEYVRHHNGVSSGPHVMLAVTDTGTGMDRATQTRIFEPFFTTKDVGKGTGLGLSTVFGIVKQSGGSIWVYSEPGHGTTFKVYMPRNKGSWDSRPPMPMRPTPVYGNETVLLVEDDPQVRQATHAILRRSGYRVIEAANPGEALLIAEQNTGTIHLLLSDVVMPRLSGPKLAERIVVMRPKIKVLFMSGFTDEAIVHHGVIDGTVAFVQKPLMPDTLLAKMRDVLDG